MLAAALDDGQNAIWATAGMEEFVPGNKRNSPDPK